MTKVSMSGRTTQQKLTTELSNDFSKEDVQEFFKSLIAQAAAKPPMMTLHIDEKSNSVELILNTKVSYYGEWISGEGGDICLYRDQETKKVIGCYLPLYINKLYVSYVDVDGEHKTLLDPNGE